MTDASQTGSQGWHLSEETRREEKVAGERSRARASYERAGWVHFAAAMMGLIAVFQIIVGLTAIFRSGTYTVPETRLVVNVDYTGWGWAHVLLGVVAAVAAYGLLEGKMWARVVGIVIASLGAVVHLAFLAANPFTAMVVIALDIVVIYAIAVYGRELGDESGY